MNGSIDGCSLGRLEDSHQKIKVTVQRKKKDTKQAKDPN